MSTQSVNRGVNVFIETGEAQKAYDRLIAKQKNFTDQLKTATDPATIKRLNTELSKLEEPITRASKKLSGELKPSLTDLSNTVKKLSTELRTMSANDPGFEKKLLQLRQANTAYTQQLNTIKGLNSQHSGLLGKFGAFAKELAGPIIALFALEKAVELVTSSIEAAIEQEQNIARFKATLDNVGRSDVFERLTRSAEGFSRKFKTIQDDDILPIFTKLIDYGKLTEKQILQLTPIIINFAAKQRISLEEATDVITKGLEGSGKALKTYGINIADAKTESERFSIITEQLGRKVEGAAEAFGETTQGKIAASKKELTELKEEIGNGLIPILNTLLGTITFIITAFKEAFHFQDLLESNRNELVAGQVEKLKGRIEGMNNEALNNEADARQKELDKTNTALDRANKILIEREKEQGLIDAGLNTKKIQKQQFSIQDIKDGIDELKSTAAFNKAYLDAIKVEQDSRNKKTLGVNAGTSTKKTTVKNFDLDSEEQKLLDRIAKALTENSDVFTKKITEINIQLDDLLHGAKRKLDEYLKNENTTLAQRNAAQKEFDQLYLDANNQRLAEIQQQLIEADKQSDLAFKNSNKRRLDEERRITKERLDAFILVQEKVAEEVARTAKRELNETAAFDELQVLKKRGKAKLEAQIKQLKDQEELELAAEDAIGSKRLLIIAEYEKKILELKRNHTAETIQQVADFISGATSQLESYYNLINAKAQAEIDSDRSVNESKKQQFQSQLDGKVITQREYQRKVTQMDKELAEKERALRIKQFQQQKLTSIAKATANVAEAVTAMLKAGPIAGQILAGIAAAIGIAQIAIIAKQKPPSYGKGGFIANGASHAQGGIKLVDSTTGRIRGEIEGGEPILSRDTYRNNKPLVDALVYNSMRRGGAPLNASWKTAPISYMNFPAIQQSMDRKFASGGFAPGAGGSQASQTDATQVAILTTLAALNQQLKNGIKAGVSLTELNIQQGRLDNLISDATAT